MDEKREGRERKGWGRREREGRLGVFWVLGWVGEKRGRMLMGTVGGRGAKCLVREGGGC